MLQETEALIINPDNTFSIERKVWDYDSIKDALGDKWLDSVSLAPYGYMYVDDMGKMTNEPINHMASQIYKWIRGSDDFIVGTVIIFGLPDEDGDDSSVSEEALINFSLCVSNDPQFFSRG